MLKVTTDTVGTPYGSPWERDALARDIAARGYQVLVHAAPAAAGERQAVRRWLRDQPWFPGTLTALAEI
jgi:hypothetical protein